MENDTKPNFVGEGLVRLGKAKMMAHPLTHDDIMAREDIKSLPVSIQDSVVIEIYRDARTARERIATTIKHQSLKDLV